MPTPSMYGKRLIEIAEKDARIAELEQALVNLVTAHNGYHMGMGPCICAAHEYARKVTGMTRDDVHKARSEKVGQ